MKNILPLFIGLILSLGLLFIQPVEARFGGGHSSSSSSHSSHSSSSYSSSRSSHSSSSYSSGGSSYSSDSSDVAGFYFILLIILFFVFLWFYCANSTTIISQRDNSRFDENQLLDFKKIDANFSRTVFLDFVHLLYVKYYRYYGKKEFNYLTPYLADNAKSDRMLDVLIGNQVIIISEIIINSIRLSSITCTDKEQIVVEIDANFTIHPAFHTQDTGKQHSRYARTERWFLQRDKGVLSLPPEKMQALTCPNCGSPAHFTDTGLCPSCQSIIHQGQQQWYVKNRIVLNQTLINSGNLISYAEEQGTQLPTLTSPTLLQEITAFEQQRAIVWSEYWLNFKTQIAQAYFIALNNAWSNRNLANVRHLISDRLYEAYHFWMELYQHYQLTNRLDNLTIQDIQLVKIELDQYYETITVRIFASCFDYTQDSANKIIAGSNKKRRAYTEYWTFARRAGVEKNQPTFNIDTCPQCGAPADKMGQTAICEYCGSKISTGEFSWVLFLITQDENYCG